MAHVKLGKDYLATRQARTVVFLAEDLLQVYGVLDARLPRFAFECKERRACGYRRQLKEIARDNKLVRRL